MPAFELPLEHEERLRPLGEPIAAFKVGIGQLAGLWFTTVGAFVFGLGGLAFLLGAVFLFRGPGGVHSWPLLNVLFGIGALGVLGGGVGGARQIWKAKGLRVLVFAEGLARVQGDTVEVLRWPDVRTVRRACLTSFERGRRAPARKLILTGADGKEFEFAESLSGWRDLRELVEQYTLCHLFPQVLEAYEAGEEVAFGQISAGPEGLRSGGRLLPWPECEAVEVANGMLTVKAGGAWLSFCKVPLQKLPNVHVLIALVEYVRKYAP